MLNKIKNALNVFTKRSITFLNKSSYGALIGSMVAAFLCILLWLTTIRTGLPFFLDIVIVALLSIFFALIAFGLAYCLYSLVSRVNKYIVSAVIGTLLFTSVFWGDGFNRLFIFSGLISGILIALGFSIKRNKILKAILLLAVLICNIFLGYSLLSKGYNHTKPVTDLYWKQNVPTISEKMDDPSLKGAFAVKHIFYGSGTDKRRKEYNSLVSIKTEPVDGSAFLGATSRVKTFLRNSYWGFSVKNLPLNGRVWYPDANGIFPLVVLVHGNHLMTDNSDAGYAYLGETLASKGFIVVSIDENFLNESWFDDYWFSEMNLRAWIILKHLEYFKQWNSSINNPFTQKIDLNNICLIGHSRGADAVALAYAFNKLDRYPFDGNVKFDFKFLIKNIIQISPVGRYKNGINFPLKMNNINYLLLYGSHDQDVYYCAGIKTYNNVSFDSAGYCKSLLYIYKANHGQFNTVWDSKDNTYPKQFFMNSSSLLSGDQQRHIAKIYISAFLQATLQNKTQLLPLLKDYRNGFDFLPKDYYISQYEDNSFGYIANFEEDHDLSTTSLKACSINASGFNTWNESRLPLRVNEENIEQENTGVYLGWEPQKAPPFYEINITEPALQQLKVGAASGFFFFIANNSDEVNDVDFSIQIKTKNCTLTRAFKDFYRLTPLLKTELAKWNFLPDLKKDMPVERIPQFVQLPFSMFKEVNPCFDPTQIEQIRFVFDKENRGAIILDKIGVSY